MFTDHLHKHHVSSTSSPTSFFIVVLLRFFLRVTCGDPHFFFLVELCVTASWHKVKECVISYGSGAFRYLSKCCDSSMAGVSLA